MSYRNWLERQIFQRRTLCNSARDATRFSVLTTVYERTSPDFFLETRDCVFSQTHSNWDWLILAHGPVVARLDALLDVLGRDPRCRVLRLSQNRGPMGGLRYCLEKAVGQYIAPLDADDLMTPDALAILNAYIVANGAPAYLFSDEDHQLGETLEHPWFRPGFDPVLLKASSYIRHLAVFRRDIALNLEIYKDRTAEWCHDWDTVLRFTESGNRCIHVPHILYHWRHHEGSSTNTENPEHGSLWSQRSVLERQVRIQPKPDLFEVREFPIFRGATEYAIMRRVKAPEKLDLLVYGRVPTALADASASAIRTAEHPFSRLHIVGARLGTGEMRRLRDLGVANILEHGSVTVAECLPKITAGASMWVAVCSERVMYRTRQWAWACDGLFRLHPEVVALAGRIQDSSGQIMAGAEIFGFDGIVGSPDACRPASDPGYYALSLKPHCCSAPYSELMVVRTDFLSRLADSVPAEVSWPSIGLWVGAEAYRNGKLIAYTPLLSAIALHETAQERFRATPEEAHLFGDGYPTMVPDTRWYSRHHQWVRGAGYQLREGDSGFFSNWQQARVQQPLPHEQLHGHQDTEP